MITAPQKNNQKRRQFCGIRRNAKKPLMKFHNIQKHPWVYITNIQKHKKKIGIKRWVKDKNTSFESKVMTRSTAS
jgi:hypothetical protein